MKIQLRPLLLILGLLFCAGISAQSEEEYRMEVGVGAGAAFSLNDANSSLFGGAKPMGGAVARFIFNPRSALKLTASYATTSGNIDGVKNFYPAHPAGTASPQRLQHSWSGGIVDVSALYELHFLPYGYFRTYLGLSRIVPYIQGGIGITYGTVDKVVAPNIPIGFGVKYKLSERLNLGLDWKMHFTTTDRLDGLQDPLGIPTSGFKKKDHYSLLTISLTYSLWSVCPTCNKDKR